MKRKIIDQNNSYLLCYNGSNVLQLASIDSAQYSVHALYEDTFVFDESTGLILFWNNRFNDNCLKNIFTSSLFCHSRRICRMWNGLYIIVAQDDNGGLLLWGFNNVIPGLDIKTPILHHIESKLIITHVAIGYSHCLILDKHGGVHSVGQGAYGQLGHGEKTTMLHHPVLIPPIHNEIIASIATGSMHSAIVSTNGNMYTFGLGTMYRLGHGNEVNCHIPTLVESLLGTGELLPNGTCTGVSSCACGVWHTIAVVKETFDVYGWGWSKFGQLGNIVENELMVVFPTRLDRLDEYTCDEEFSSVSCNNQCTIIRTKRNKVILMGSMGMKCFLSESSNHKFDEESLWVDDGDDGDDDGSGKDDDKGQKSEEVISEPKTASKRYIFENDERDMDEDVGNEEESVSLIELEIKNKVDSVCVIEAFMNVKTRMRRMRRQTQLDGVNYNECHTIAETTKAQLLIVDVMLCAWSCIVLCRQEEEKMREDKEK